MCQCVEGEMADVVMSDSSPHNNFNFNNNNNNPKLCVQIASGCFSFFLFLAPQFFFRDISLLCVYCQAQRGSKFDARKQLKKKTSQQRETKKVDNKWWTKFFVRPFCTVLPKISTYVLKKGKTRNVNNQC